MPLHLVERTWHDVMGRDPSATPGAVVLVLRTIAAARAAVPALAREDHDNAAPAPPAAAAPAMARVVGEQERRLQQLWQATMGTLRAQLPRPEFETWLRDTTLVTLEQGVATISATTTFQKECLENRYLAPIRRALGDLLGGSIQARVVVRARGPG